MTIIRFELKKIFRSPVVWGLIGIFLVLNGILIASHSYVREELAFISQMVQRFGTEINDESLGQWEAWHANALARANELVDGSYDSAGAYLDANRWLEEPAFLEPLVLEGYLAQARGIDQTYETMDFSEKAEEDIAM